MSKATSDLFSGQQNQKEKRHIYTVSEITRDIKLILENTFTDIWVEGEVSGVRKIPTGTLFFNLKDDTSIIKCVIFASNLQTLKFEFKDGIQIICLGHISVYDKRGEYQLYAKQIEPKGIGSLQLALEQLKEKLEKEGLFSPEHKRPIPYLPSKIGVVTSISGAAIKDILKVLDRRFSDIHIIINPVQVQGEGAKEDIARAIKEFNEFNDKLPRRERVEVMIVGRGGGSIEDLWAFNEEIVARAIYNSKIPVIAAVGHERDWTIADLVADLRAATPSVAAELVIPKKEDLREKVDDLAYDLKRSFLDMSFNFQEAIDDFAHRLTLGMQNLLKLSDAGLESAQKKLALLNPLVLVRQHKERILDLARQIYVRMQHFITLKQAELRRCVENLSGLSPLNILGRGYSIAFKMPQNLVIKETTLIKPGDTIKTRLHKGEILSQVTEVDKNG
jgi:exodeoxyribonuclease VII large subunit